VGRTGSGSCLAAGLGISGVEIFGYFNWVSCGTGRSVNSLGCYMECLHPYEMEHI
jgi:hypothetical protein